MLQHGDFFDDPAVAAASVLHECLAADEVLVGSFSCATVGDSRRLGLLRSSMLRRRKAVSMLLLAQPISRFQIIRLCTRTCRRGNSVIEPEEDEIELVHRSPCIGAT